MKKMLAVVLLAAMLLGLSACTKPNDATTDGGKTLRVASLKDMTTMDVAQTTDDYFVPQNILTACLKLKSSPTAPQKS